MEPELAGRKLWKRNRPQQEVDQIGEKGTEEEKPDIDFWIPKYPSKQEECSSEVPKEHRLADEDPPAVHTPGDVILEGLCLLCRRERHVTATADSVFEPADRHPFLHLPEPFIEVD